MKENIDQPRMLPTQRGKGVSQGLDGVRKAAREHLPSGKFVLPEI
jgi:hypothetical protein